MTTPSSAGASAADSSSAGTQVPEPDPAESSSGNTRGKKVYPAMAVAIFILAAPLWWAASQIGPVIPVHRGQILIGLGLAALFVLCELFPLRIEVRRETMLISLTEVPLVIGLLTVPAAEVGTVSIGASLLVYLFRRDNWRYVLLNLALISLEIGTAAAVYGALTGDTPGGLQQFVAAFVGVPAGAVLSCLAVGVSHRLIGSVEPFSRVLVRSVVASGANTVFTLVIYQLVDTGTAGRLLAVALILAMLVLYRTYASFLRQHLDLSRIYDFSRKLAQIGTAEQDWLSLLDQVREQVNAKVATLHLTEPILEFTTLAVGPDGQLPSVPNDPGDDPEDAVRKMAAAQGQVHLAADRTDDPRLLEAVASRGAWDVLAVSMRVGRRDIGYLEVRDRRSRWGRFGANDLRVLETLGRNVASALDNLRLVESLRYDAHHDSATGLLNRRGLIRAADTAMAAGTVTAAVVIDIGILAEVSSAVGYDRGDQLLYALSRRLRDELGFKATLAHLEADRFAVLLVGLSQTDAELAAHELTALVDQPLSMGGGVDVEPRVHAGLAFVRHDDELDEPQGAALLLQHAEMALTSAKSSDLPLRVYASSMGEVVRRRFQLVTQFRRAVHQGNITVQYQPKVSIADRDVVGVEALVRWNHPEFGWVSPAEFIEAIEATGSIDTLFDHVLDLVLGQLKVWEARRQRIPVAVNLSMRNLVSTDFPTRIAAALGHYDVAPDLLTFEITESSVMADPARSMPLLRQLHATGIRLSVDDFGTGYSSLAYLRRLPIDEIKIDRSFVQSMTTDLGDRAIVRAITDLGHSLGLRVVAEGVEDDAARDALRALRCDDMQGFLISRALPPDKFDSWLRSRTTAVKQHGLAADVLRMVNS